MNINIVYNCHYCCLLSEKKGDSTDTSELKSSKSEPALAQKICKVGPPPGFRDTVKDGTVEVKPTSRHGDVEPPPGFKGEVSQPSKASKRRAEDSEEAQAKKLKGINKFCILAL